jgi:phage terminase Nu1 subunit (DNA packaging protein)
VPRYVKRTQAAQIFQVSERTIRNWIGQGYIIGYRAGPRLIVVDVDEIERMLAVTPVTKARDGRKIYGKKSTIINLSSVVLPGVQR